MNRGYISLGLGLAALVAVETFRPRPEARGQDFTRVVYPEFTDLLTLCATVERRVLLSGDGAEYDGAGLVEPNYSNATALLPSILYEGGPDPTDLLPEGVTITWEGSGYRLHFNDQLNTNPATLSQVRGVHAGNYIRAAGVHSVTTPVMAWYTVWGSNVFLNAESNVPVYGAGVSSRGAVLTVPYLQQDHMTAIENAIKGMVVAYTGPRTDYDEWFAHRVVWGSSNENTNYPFLFPGFRLLDHLPADPDRPTDTRTDDWGEGEEWWLGSLALQSERHLTIPVASAQARYTTVPVIYYTEDYRDDEDVEPVTNAGWAYQTWEPHVGHYFGASAARLRYLPNLSTQVLSIRHRWPISNGGDVIWLTNSLPYKTNLPRTGFTVTVTTFGGWKTAEPELVDYSADDGSGNPLLGVGASPSCEHEETVAGIVTNHRAVFYAPESTSIGPSSTTTLSRLYGAFGNRPDWEGGFGMRVSPSPTITTSTVYGSNSMLNVVIEDTAGPNVGDRVILEVVDTAGRLWNPAWSRGAGQDDTGDPKATPRVGSTSAGALTAPHRYHSVWFEDMEEILTGLTQYRREWDSLVGLVTGVSYFASVVSTAAPGDGIIAAALDAAWTTAAASPTPVSGITYVNGYCEQAWSTSTIPEGVRIVATISGRSIKSLYHFTSAVPIKAAAEGITRDVYLNLWDWPMYYDEHTDPPGWSGSPFGPFGRSPVVDLAPGDTVWFPDTMALLPRPDNTINGRSIGWEIFWTLAVRKQTE